MAVPEKSNIFDVIQLNYKIAKYCGLFLHTIGLDNVPNTTHTDYAVFLGYILFYGFLETYNFGLTTYLEATNSEITKIGFVLGRFFITTAALVIFLLMFFQRKNLARIIFNVHLIDQKVSS